MLKASSERLCQEKRGAEDGLGGALGVEGQQGQSGNAGS